jgi:Glycosyl hydrolase family 92
LGTHAVQVAHMVVPVVAPCSTSAQFDYVALGYVPMEQTDKSASITLEFAYDDGVLARVAQFLGDNATFATFHNRSMFYKWGTPVVCVFVCPVIMLSCVSAETCLAGTKCSCARVMPTARWNALSFPLSCTPLATRMKK